MKKYLPWLLCLAILVIGFGTIYGVVQQSQRSAANMPQIQLAEDAVPASNSGGLGPALISTKVDMAKSLAPFTNYYDKSGQAIVGSGYIDGKLAAAPLGILKAAKGKSYHAVTWQPRKDVRIAAVTVATKNGYVLSGRNLKEVEKNENTSLLLALIGGIIAMALLGLVFVFSEILAE